MSLIHKLDEITINKIAAGEVIENPSSVVKELVDNALDAGATTIHIDIRGGGRELIRIKDNGLGMNQEDALLCLERHATSKLKTIEDIYALETRGFRGEALPSIASISKMTLLTCPRGEKVGSLVVVEGGHISLTKQVAAQEGTQIEVENLFFNVPVRRKFQRSPSHDAADVQKMLTLLALAHPNVSFHLTHNGKTLFLTKEEQGPFNETLKRRIETLLNDDFSKSLHKIDEKMGPYELQGWISPPFLTRPNKTGQYIFVNGRAVQSPLISFAVKEAFGYSIGQNRYPLFVLSLRVRTDLVDINVHPQKKEVRFQQEPALKEFIVKTIEKNLHALGVVPVFEFIPKEKPPFPEIKIEESHKETPRSSYRPFEPQKMRPQQPLPPIVETTAIEIIATIAPYILAFIDHEPFLIDQVRAKNRLFFNKIGKEPLQSQKLLIPFSIPIEGLELELFEPLGFSIKNKNNELMVDAIPSILSQEEAKAFLLEAIHDPVTPGIEDQKKRLTKRLATITSKKKLNPFEAEALVKNLLKHENNVLCPFGQPIRVPLTADKLKQLIG